MALVVGFLMRMRKTQHERLFGSQSSSRAFPCSVYSIIWSFNCGFFIPAISQTWVYGGTPAGREAPLNHSRGLRGVLPAILLTPGLWGCSEQVLGTVVLSVSSVEQFRRGMSPFDQPQLVAFVRRLKFETDPGISICRSPSLKKPRKSILFILAYKKKV